jgi:hypothetical protein
MRLVGAVLAFVVGTLAALAQTENAAAPPGPAARPAAQPGKFRKPVLRPKSLHALAAARRARVTGQPSSPSAGAASDGTIRSAATAGRKRTPAPAAPATPKREGSLPLGDRMAMQFELAWTGDYNGAINGELNEKLTAAIKSFQRNRKFKETGALNTQERALLASVAKARQSQVGWVTVDDPATGARLGLPTKQVPFKTQSRTGTHWASAQGQVQVETFRLRDPGTTLAAVYEQQKKEPSTRKLDINLLRPDFFVLAGMQGLKRFAVRADFKGGEVRGLTVLYDQATETIMEPVAAAMVGAFTAFPGVAAVAQIGPPSRRKVEYGTGIVVSAAGHILADRQITDGCNVIVAAGYGDADRQAEDKTSDLALLRVYGVADLVPAEFSGEPVKAVDVTLLGIADPQTQGGGSANSAVAARLRGDALEPAPQIGFSGGAAVDAQGRLVGMVKLKNAVVAQVGSSEAPLQATLVPASTIRGFLEPKKLAPVAARSGIEAARAALVRVICVRK